MHTVPATVFTRMPMAKAKSCMSWLTRQRTCRGPLADSLNGARQVVLVAFSPAVMAHADAENVCKRETDAMSFTRPLAGRLMPGWAHWVVAVFPMASDHLMPVSQTCSAQDTNVMAMRYLPLSSILSRSMACWSFVWSAAWGWPGCGSFHATAVYPKQV